MNVCVVKLIKSTFISKEVSPSKIIIYFIVALLKLIVFFLILINS